MRGIEVGLAYNWQVGTHWPDARWWKSNRTYFSWQITNTLLARTKITKPAFLIFADLRHISSLTYRIKKLSHFLSCIEGQRFSDNIIRFVKDFLRFFECWPKLPNVNENGSGCFVADFRGGSKNVSSLHEKNLREKVC